MSKYDDIKNGISIVDYARSIRLHPVKIGSFYTLKEHDSVRINPVKNIFYRNSTGDCGSVIDFAVCFGNKTLSEAIKELSEYIHGKEVIAKEEIKKPIKEEKGKKALILPVKDKTYRNVYAYLCKTRMIDSEIVDFMIKNKMLYQDIHRNCVFVAYKDGEAKFACIRGTNTYKKFIADVSGSDYSYCFPIEFENANRLVITESVIDALSLMCLDKSKSDYLALAGVCKFEAAITKEKIKEYHEIIIALDNDKAGRGTALLLKKHILELKTYRPEQVKIIVPKNYKDWNDVLVRLRKKCE